VVRNGSVLAPGRLCSVVRVWAGRRGGLSRGDKGILVVSSGSCVNVDV
jgi:hypothetical protein